MNAKQIIEKNGGCAELARKLGLENPTGCRRVFQWQERNHIPAEWILSRPDLFSGYAFRNKHAPKATAKKVKGGGGCQAN